MSKSPDQTEHGKPLLPDPAVCRARRVLPALVECLVAKPKPNCCPHATVFGNGIYCEHPSREEIVIRTNAWKRMEGRKPMK